MEQPERAAEEIDARGEDRRTNAVVVEHQRLDEVVEMALVIRDVERRGRARVASARVLDVLGDAADLSENRVERMLQRAVEAVPLCRAELVEIRLRSRSRASSSGRAPSRRYSPTSSRASTARVMSSASTSRTIAERTVRFRVNGSWFRLWFSVHRFIVHRL